MAVITLVAAVMAMPPRLAVAQELAVTAKPAAAAPAAPAAKEETNPYVWSPRVTSAAVFKNGLGFFLREGEVELRDGWCLAKEVPPAAFGTLAIFAYDKDYTVDVVGAGPGEVVEFDGKDAPKDVESRRARLELSKHLSVQLTYMQAKAERTAAGKLRSVGPEYVVLENDANNFAVPLKDIVKMQVLELSLRVHVNDAQGKPAARAKLGMAYLRKGITWIPEYTLKLLDEESAELSLRGTLVNEAEDLVHADVHLVVGVPHFVHTEYLAPIAVGQVIRAVAAGVVPGQFTSQIMNRAAIVSNSIMTAPDIVAQPVAPPPGDIDRVVGNLPKVDGPATSDYTVYTKNDLTVRRGEKAIITILRQKIRYSHVYRWSPPAAMEHFLVLHNTTDTAWTTGPVLALSQDRPLSEDMLKYTPKGGATEVPVTTAVNVSHDRIEKEIDRKLKAHSPRTEVYYDLVTLKGQLAIKNFEKRPVIVYVSAAVSGKPIEAGEGGAISVDSSKLQLLERTGTANWKVTLEPGESKTLTYVYERYVQE